MPHYNYVYIAIFVLSYVTCYQIICLYLIKIFSVKLTSQFNHCIHVAIASHAFIINFLYYAYCSQIHPSTMILALCVILLPPHNYIVSHNTLLGSSLNCWFMVTCCPTQSESTRYNYIH